MAERAEADAVAEIARQGAEPRTVTLGAGAAEVGATVLVAPMGAQIVSAKRFVEEWAERPARRHGTARLETCESFIDHVKRHACETSVVFASETPPCLTAVYDYNEPGPESQGENLARFGRHRAQYACPLSEEWRAWTGIAGAKMNQSGFAELIEQRIADVLDPAQAGEGAQRFAAQLGVRLATPAVLMSLSRGLALTVNQRVQNAVNLASGEGQIAYVVEHQNSETGQPLTVPGAFLLALRVFDRGAAYQVPVRLRYRAAEGKVTWTVELYRADRCLADAFAGVCKQVSEGTGLPLFMGAPES